MERCIQHDLDDYLSELASRIQKHDSLIRDTQEQITKMIKTRDAWERTAKRIHELREHIARTNYGRLAAGEGEGDGG